MTMPRRIGPYTVTGQLGKGGMGVVYRGEHRETGQAVAIKTVRVPSGASLRGMRREIRTLARLQHPGVVRILDTGEQAGVPWYAMELVTGMTLRHYHLQIAGTLIVDTAVLSRSAATPAEPPAFWSQSLSKTAASATAPGETGPLAVRRLRGDAEKALFEALLSKDMLVPTLDLIRRVCHPLAFLHGEGIVHRDLKPDNILITPDKRPVLVDFGLIAEFTGAGTRELLAVDQKALGTAYYMAPEQIRGELIDARADLYALGCVLFELLTGRPPFCSSSVTEVLKAHLVAPPPPLRSLRPEADPDLERLLQRLLAKEPNDRIGYATDVAHILDRFCGAPPVEVAELPAPRPYLYRPRFVGRRRLMQAMASRLDRLESGQGGVILVEGDRGVGKTRLVMEFARRAARQKFRVVTGSCLHGDGRAFQVFLPLLQAVADTCRELGADDARPLIERGGALLSIYSPALADLVAPEVRDAAAKLGRDLGVHRITRALVDLMGVYGRDRPIVLLVDDLQWADGLSMQVLAACLDEGLVAKVPLLIVGTARSEDGVELMGREASDPAFLHLHLGPLENRAVRRVIRDMLALERPPRPLEATLVERSEGNPYYIAEFLRHAVDMGLLTRTPVGTWAVSEKVGREGSPSGLLVGVPTSLREVLAGRLDALSAGARRVVDAAAVCGREAPALLLWQLSGLEHDEILAAVEELDQRRVLAEASVGNLRFTHDALREVALEGLSRRRRRQLHRDAAMAYEQLFRAQLEDNWSRIAFHWERAGAPRRALRPYLEAARVAARKRFALAEAERWYRDYLRLADPAMAEALQARFELADAVLAQQGRNDEALAHLQDALDGATRLGADRLRGQCLRAIAAVLYRLGRLDEAWDHCSDALTLQRRTGDVLGQAASLDLLSTLERERGRLHEARDLAREALHVRRRAGDLAGEAESLTHLAIVEADLGHPDKAAYFYREAVGVAREIGARHIEARALMNLAMMVHLRGDWQGGRDLLDQALVVARDIGDRWTEATITRRLADLHADVGHLTIARSLYESALLLWRQLGDRLGEASTWGRLGAVCRDMGFVGAAAFLLTRARCDLERIGAPEGVALQQIALSRLYRLCGDVRQGRRALKAATHILRQSRDLTVTIACLVEMGHAELSLGRSAGSFVAEGQRLATLAGARLDVDHGLGGLLNQLRRAQHLFASGRAAELVSGEAPGDVPAALRRRQSRSATPGARAINRG